jgi:rhodanese-related sulfurtransferase
MLSKKIMKARNAFLAILILFLFSFSIQGFTQNTAYKALLKGLYDPKFPILKPAEISSLANYQVLDTREKEEFEVSHLKGAKWVGYDTFELKSIQNLDKNKPVLVYCTVGARSQEIGKRLKEAGFKQVYNLYGGIIHWSNEQKPIFNADTLTKKVHTYNRIWSVWLTSGEKYF